MDARAQARLTESLRAHGQQVPVLLRPHPSTPGRFEIVYGRRRLAALRDLGRPVRAMVRQLDDHALTMAQGQENTSRQDLSFIEKASFAAQLDLAGYDRDAVAAALSTDLPMVSRMLNIGHAFPLPLLRAIGSAPAVGRDRWAELAKLYARRGVAGRIKASIDGPDFRGDSNARFEAVLARAEGRRAIPAAAPPARDVTADDGTVVVDGTVAKATGTDARSMAP